MKVRVVCRRAHTWTAPYPGEGPCPECGSPGIGNNVHAHGPFAAKRPS